MPLQATSGAASYDAFGGGVPVEPNYIESVFQTWLYTGNGSTQTITNGIDLAGEGGLVWTKPRSNVTGDFPFNDHILVDSARGNFQIQSNTTAANNAISSFDFSSTGYTAPSNLRVNQSGVTYASWTFREQPKFFDIVTYTGTGSNTTIAHNLGSVPGCIMVKRTDTTANWAVYHRSLANTQYLVLNLTNAPATGATWWNSTTPTSSVFSVGTDATVNASGGTYVAYVFAHDAGGFGLTGTDNVISCGSFTTNGSGAATVDLGYEPQWVMIKKSSVAGDWWIADNMRGLPITNQSSKYLSANTSDTEGNLGVSLINNGFDRRGDPSETYIYIAIRRGPMKVPTSGTSVFTPDLYTGNGTTQSVTSGSPPLDLVWIKGRTGSNNPRLYDRLRGATKSLAPDSTAAETTRADGLTAFTQTGFTVGSFGNENESGVSIIAWDFKRAPSFFDEVCYTGTGANATITHNLAAVPELMITKSRSNTYDWAVYAAGVGNTSYGLLNDPGQFYVDSSAWNNTSPTSSVFTVGTGTYMNGSGATYVAYLFATCAGVSKVGSYTGTGTTKQIDCGFTGGARFVLIKRTDSTGDWYVWDTARGIVSGNDPYLLLNTSTNEVTSTDYIDTYSAGFEISSTAPAAINASGGSFIFFAVA